MKRIGILTFHFSNHNFGALLQTYASVTILRKMGFEPTVIHLISTDVNQTKTNFFISLLVENPFDKFRREFIPLTELIDNEKALFALNDRFDVFYVGSDQVWRQEFAKVNILHYFLDFVSIEKLKVSYAASFGKDKVDYDPITMQSINQFIQRFDAVGVRETSGEAICKTEFGIDATKVLDPTLLLNELDYSAIYKQYSCNCNSKFIAYYDLECTFGVSERVKPFLDYYNLAIKNIYRDKINLFFKTITPVSSVARWLQMLRSSVLVITNSYHCVIFSILFRKDFIVLASEFGGNARLFSLLNDLGLSNRFFEKFDKDKIDHLEPINYDSVLDKLAELRKVSFDFLEILN